MNESRSARPVKAQSAFDGHGDVRPFLDHSSELQVQLTHSSARVVDVDQLFAQTAAATNPTISILGNER